MSYAAAAGAVTSIESLIGSYRERRISRARVVVALTAAGASAAAAAMLVNAAEQTTPALQPQISEGGHHQAPAPTVDHAQAHAQHVANQVAGTAAATPEARSAAVAKMLHDYSPNAVVNDPMFGAPIVGHAAIAVHKAAEMAAISEVQLNVLSRAVVGDQVLATWSMRAKHTGRYYSRYPATHKQIELSGATVQTRGQDGRITTETLYYDAAHMRRQLSGW